MDHKAFVASLPAARKAELHARSDAPGLRRLVVYLMAIVFCASAVLAGWWVMMLPLGILLSFLFTLEHEATHKTPFASERLNEWVGWACGLVLILPFTWFRYFHLAHHRFTHDPERDPELLAGQAPQSWAGYLLHVSGWRYWRGMVVQFCLLVAGRGMADYIPVSAGARVVAEARGMAVIYAIAGASLFYSPALFWIWILPSLIGQPFVRLYLMAEHGRCAHVADMFANTRTTYTTALIRWLAWNMPYHAEHHAMPNVPFHKLPDLHDLTQAHLKETEEGYARFHRRYVDAF